jgi:hypothetical protein
VPALVIGTILTAFGLILFLKTGDTPTDGFPDGDVTGPTFLGFETNGWTAWFTTAAGALLLFGAAQHLLAKAMSLIVGLALGAAAIIALVDGDVLGLAAANGWTELGWGIAAVLLVLNALMPRTSRTREVERSDRREPVTTNRDRDRDHVSTGNGRHDGAERPTVATTHEEGTHTHTDEPRTREPRTR